MLDVATSLDGPRVADILPVRLVVKNTFLKFELDYSPREDLKENHGFVTRSKSDGHLLKSEYGISSNQKEHIDKRFEFDDKDIDTYDTSSHSSNGLEHAGSDEEDDTEVEREDSQDAPLDLRSTGQLQACVPHQARHAPSLLRFDCSEAPCFFWTPSAQKSVAPIETNMELQIAEAERKVQRLRAEVAAQRARWQGGANRSLDADIHPYGRKQIGLDTRNEMKGTPLSRVPLMHAAWSGKPLPKHVTSLP
jgi:hypothetical protein